MCNENLVIKYFLNIIKNLYQFIIFVHQLQHQQRLGSYIQILNYHPSIHHYCHTHRGMKFLMFSLDTSCNEIGEKCLQKCYNCATHWVVATNHKTGAIYSNLSSNINAVSVSMKLSAKPRMMWLRGWKCRPFNHFSILDMYLLMYLVASSMENVRACF